MRRREPAACLGLPVSDFPGHKFRFLFLVGLRQNTKTALQDLNVFLLRAPIFLPYLLSWCTVQGALGGDIQMNRGPLSIDPVRLSR